MKEGGQGARTGARIKGGGVPSFGPRNAPGGRRRKGVCVGGGVKYVAESGKSVYDGVKKESS
jgi:hypothetical protein